MDNLIDWAAEHSTKVVAIGAALTTIAVFFKRLRVWSSDFTAMPAISRRNSEQLAAIDLRTRITEEIVWMRDRSDDTPVYWVEADGKDISRVNSAFAKLMGLTEKDLIDGQGTSYVVEEDKRRVDEGWERAVETGTTFECTFTHMNAGKIHAKTQPILLGCGKIGGWIGEITKVDNLERSRR